MTATGGATGAFDGIDIVNQGNGNIALEAGGAIAATVQFGVRAEAHGTGNISVVMDAGSTVNLGGAGSLGPQFRDVACGFRRQHDHGHEQRDHPFRHHQQSQRLGRPGYRRRLIRANGTANTNINGTVVVNNNGNVTAAAGYGVDAYSYGNGNVTVNEGASTSVSGAQYGIAAFGNSFGTGNVAINIAANATISGGSIFGIQAFENEVGNVSVTTAAGDLITGGSSGINVQSQATSGSSSSSVTVIANGTIHSGTNLTPNNSTPSGIAAGFSPGGLNQANNNVAGNVFVQSNATIVAAAGAGINAYNYGKGNVTVTTGATSSTTGATTGTQADGINANTLNGGNVSVTNGGSVTGGTAYFSSTIKAGSITIENDGTITATAFFGINLSQSATGATGSAVITNTGTVSGAANHSAINVTETAAGSVTINNSGTIGLNPGSSSTTRRSPRTGGSSSSTTAARSRERLHQQHRRLHRHAHNNAGGVWRSGVHRRRGNHHRIGPGSIIETVGNSIGMTVGSMTHGLHDHRGGRRVDGELPRHRLAAGSHGTVTITGTPDRTATVTSGEFQNIGVGFDGRRR